MKYIAKYLALIPVVTLVFAAFAVAPKAHALSCLPVDMYLESVAKEESGETLVFVGTATQVTKNHTQVVTVTSAKKGWVAPMMWVTHPYSTDWQYFCSNGPAKVGVPTLFLVTIDEYGSFNVTQTLDMKSAEAKAFIKTLADAKTDAGITEATPEERANAVRESIKSLIASITKLFEEYRYWAKMK